MHERTNRNQSTRNRVAAHTPGASEPPAAAPPEPDRTAAAGPAAGPTAGPAAAGKSPRTWPLAGLGYAIVTALGFAWGAIWSTGPVTRQHGLWVFTGMPRWTFGRGGSCVGGCYLTRHNVSEPVLRHEAVHERQWRRYGLALPLLYQLAGRNPLTNRFEIEAGLEDGGYLPRRRPASPRPPAG